LRIILVNLISNSIKFKKADEKAIVKVNLKTKADLLTISVKDNGQGMDLNDPNNLVFSLFNRSSENRAIKGYGIGLYMIKKVIERNQGQIKLESQLGVGTDIQITFPLK
jgi:signal transduction histidine kinase